MKNTKTYKTLAATTLGVVTLGAGIAFAANDNKSISNTQNTNTTQKVRGDKTPAEFQNLTDAQKATLEQAHTLFESGKADEAKTLLTNAGIKMPERPQGDKGGKGGMRGDMKKVDEAIISGDYATFKSLASTTPLANINEATFNSLKAPMQARKAADDQVQSILKSAGITMAQKDVNTSTVK